MPLDDFDIVPLARLDAEFNNDGQNTVVRHRWHHTWQADRFEDIVWKRTDELGQGAFGAVFREECIHGSTKGTVRAVKKILKPTSFKRKTNTQGIDVGRELEAMVRFSKPEYERHFVQSSGWFESNDAFFITMELVQHGSLQQYMNEEFPESETRLLITQILEGLYFMHRLGYAHRDLKPPNLLVVHEGPVWHIKIADFGLSKRIAEDISSLHTVAGTPGYSAPEVLGISDDSDDSDEENHLSYTNAVDIWAAGVIMYALLTASLPFPSSNHKALGKYVRGRGPFPIELLNARRITSSACDLVKSLMAPNPVQRPSAGSSLQHSWLKDSWEPAAPRDPPSLRSPVSGSVVSGSWTSKDSGYDTIVGNPPQSNETFRRGQSQTTAVAQDEKTLRQARTDPTQGFSGAGFSKTWSTAVPLDLPISLPVNVRGSVDYQSFSSDGNLLLISSGKYTKNGRLGENDPSCLELWNASKAERLFASGKARVPYGTLSWDGQFLAYFVISYAPEFETFVAILNIAKGTTKTLRGRPLPARSRDPLLALSPDGSFLASNLTFMECPETGPDVIMIYDIASGKVANTFLMIEHTSLRAFTFSPDSRLLAAVVEPASWQWEVGWKIVTWRTNTKEERPEPMFPFICLGPGDSVSGMGFSPDGRFIRAWNTNSEPTHHWCWETDSGKLVQKKSVEIHSTFGLIGGVSQDGLLLAWVLIDYQSKTSQITITDVQDPEKAKKRSEHIPGIFCGRMDFSPDCTRLTARAMGAAEQYIFDLSR